MLVYSIPLAKVRRTCSAQAFSTEGESKKASFGEMWRPVRGASVLLILSALSISPTLFAQSRLEIAVAQFSEKEIQGYIQPLGDLLAANIHAGVHHGASIPKGFYLQIDLLGVASIIGDQHRVYDARLPAGFVPEGGSLKTATVFGGRGTVFRDVATGLEYKGSDGLFSGKVLPLFAPQLRLGSLWGSELVFRYMRTPQISSQRFIPTNSVLWGAGVRHSISQYLANPQVDIAVSAFLSGFSLDELISFSGVSYGVQVSKSLPLITLYSGLAYERSTLHVRYRYGLSSSHTIAVTLEATNQFRVTTGMMLDLQAIRIFADANFGNVQHFAGGIGFGL